MSLGLAVAVLAAGAIADDLGHARVLAASAGLLAAASAARGATLRRRFTVRRPRP
jgi:hypothetical protein